jgi:hypothetical protein
METNSPKWVWKLGTDPAEVHELLCSCDRFQAERYQSPVPQRSFAATEQRVREGSVHVLYAGDRPAGMFTLTWEASDQPDTPRAARLGRLAVDPRQLADGGLIGVQCVRRAVDVAREIGAEVLRSEANPDLAAGWRCRSPCVRAVSRRTGAAVEAV